jgi:hypothetical protein
MMLMVSSFLHQGIFFNFKNRSIHFIKIGCGCVCPRQKHLCSGADYTFATIYDSYGDGMRGRRMLQSYYCRGRNRCVEGGDFGHCESVSLCYPASKPPTPGVPTVSENPSNPPSPAISITHTHLLFLRIHQVRLESRPSPSNAPSVSKAPSSTTPSVFCPEGIAVKIEIFTDSNPFATY